jgi:aminoglycoside/choline kinase family phosphotransferase
MNTMIDARLLAGTEFTAQSQLHPGLPVLAPASADASFRRYFRVTWPNGETAILMDAPPDKEDVRAFVQIAGLMADAQIVAPKILAADTDNGYLLLNDLGSTGYLKTLHAADVSTADTLMRGATQALIKWQLSSKADILPAYDDALLRRELAIFPEWCVARHAGIELTEKEQGWLNGVMEALVTSALAQPQVFVHRDYMPRNMMLTDDLSTPAILDFQDAVYGPITYDVVSLFRDAFISWDEARELDWVIRYWEQARKAGLPVHADFGDFWRAYEFMGLQRHLKVLGIFCRLNYRDGKTHYLEDLPRFFNYAYRTAERYAELRPLVPILERLSPRDLQIGYTF